MALLLAVISGLAALAGGLLALAQRRKLRLTLAFTAGLLLGLLAFDILPEIFELSGDSGLDLRLPMAAMVVGFLLFHVVEKLLLVHHSHEHQYSDHKHPRVGVA